MIYLEYATKLMKLAETIKLGYKYQEEQRDDALNVEECCIC